MLDAVREIKPPFSPEGVVDQFAALIKSYRRSTVVGDSASDAALLIRETHRSWRKGLYNQSPGMHDDIANAVAGALVTSFRDPGVPGIRDPIKFPKMYVV